MMLSITEKAALLSGKNTWLSRDLPAQNLRSISFSDGPHGVRKQLGSGDHLGLNASVPATCFPTAATLSSSWDVELVERVGEALGKEAAFNEVDVLLGPGLNIKRDPRCGRNFEYFSEDPLLAGSLASAFVKGVQSTGTSACPKHFAVNSQEMRRMASNSVVDERTLREIYLAAFEQVVSEAKPRVIMSSYNRVNGTYTNENHHLLQEILRDEWGFDGLVVTDWGGGNDPVAAITAGGTLEMPSPGFDSARRILEAYQAGELTEDEIDQRVAELLALAGRERAHKPTVDFDAHHALACEAAARSSVLLKNENQLLPLAAGTRVAVIGDMATTPRYQGAGSSLVNPTRLDIPAEALHDSSLDVVQVVKGYERSGKDNSELLAEAVEAAKSAQVAILFVGLDELRESEGMDRTDTRMAQNQIDLINAVHAANANTVVVLCAGAPVEMPWIDSAKALLHVYLGGQAGGSAIARVLTGAEEPAGRLAETYAKSLSQHPTAHTFPACGPDAVYSEGVMVGYRHFDTAGEDVLFPFGYGLGYGQVEYLGLAADEKRAVVTIKNTGERPTSEVVQLYIFRPDSSVQRPAQELGGFSRVELAPGEQKDITISFTDRTFRHYSVEDEAWLVEGGMALIRVGRNSRDLLLEASIVLEGREVAKARVGKDSPRTTPVLSEPEAKDQALVSQRRDLEINDPLRAMKDAKSPVARIATSVLEALMTHSDKSGKPNLNLLFIYNMPFRAIGKMSGGIIGTPEVEGILDFVNNKPLQGLRKIASGAIKTRKAASAITRQIEGNRK